MNKVFTTIIVIIAVIIAVFLLLYPYVVGNREVGDFKQTYDYAIIQRADGEQEIEIASWRDYEGEQIQITDVGGTTYLVNSVDVILVKYGE